MILTKEQRMDLIRKKFSTPTAEFAEMPISKVEVRETLEELDGYREFDRDKKSTTEALNSDEI